MHSGLRAGLASLTVRHVCVCVVEGLLSLALQMLEGSHSGVSGCYCLCVGLG